MASVRIIMPEKAQMGEEIEIKTLIQHDMETGHRRDRFGAVISRNLINEFVVRYGGAEVFRAEFFPGMAANPYVAFRLRAASSGQVTFEWRGDENFLVREGRMITVED
jgi:sulfur-oxidizing protein SoxZ